MDWIRANKSLAAILGVAIAGAIGLGAYAVMGYMAYGESLEAMQTLSGKVASMEKAKLYPSEENVAAKDEKVSAYEDEVSKLGRTLLTLQKDVTSPPITDTDFQGKLKQNIAEFRQKADTARMAIPKDFAFGFDTYTRSLPAPAATQDLNDYFDGVNAIVTSLFDNGVRKIDTISRTELAVEKGAAAPKQPKKVAPPPPAPKVTKTKPGKGGKGKKAAAAPKPPVEIAQVVEKRTVSLDIVTDQAPLQKVLNALASASAMKHFTVLRLLRIENEKQEGPLTNGRPKSGSQGFDIKNSAGLVTPVVETPPTGENAAAATAKAEVIEVAKPAEPDAEKVLGGEMLRVHLEIDVVRFLEP